MDDSPATAMLGQSVLRSLSGERQLVGDILDPTQEARFHDVRIHLDGSEVAHGGFGIKGARLGELPTISTHDGTSV